jgi:CheY-like chemotaxis protein
MVMMDRHSAGTGPSLSAGGRAREGALPLTALVVDDEKSVRAMLVEILSELGYRCVEAGDGEGALELLDDHAPSLGVLDLALPGMSGAELAWRIKEKRPEMPLVAVSGRLQMWDNDDLKDLGFARIFPKPMDCDEFVRFCEGIASTGPRGRGEA